jgi:hypothetical protein
MVYRDDHFYTIKKLLSLPRNNPLFKEGQRIAKLASANLLFRKRLPDKAAEKRSTRKKPA